MKKPRKNKIADLSKMPAFTLNEPRGIKKVKTWYTNGDTETTTFLPNNGGWKKQFSYKKGEQNVRKK